MTHPRLVPDTDTRPWCEDIPERLTLPVQPVELLTAELYARGIVTKEAFIEACAGSQVRAGLALDMWSKPNARGLP